MDGEVDIPKGEVLRASVLAPWLDELARDLPDEADPRRADVDRAKALAWQIEREAIEPVFRAASSEEFWRTRDEMFRRGVYWWNLLARLRNVARRVVPEEAMEAHLPGRLLEQIEQRPPDFLSADARARLREGLILAHRASGGQIPAGPTVELPAEAIEPRFAAIFASVVLLNLWASVLVRGLRPASDEVADSVAKNYSNVLAGFLGMMSTAPVLGDSKSVH